MSKESLKTSEINEQILSNYIAIITELLDDGEKILKLIISFRLRNELRLIIFGGKFILHKIKKNRTKLLKKRPVIRK